MLAVRGAVPGTGATADRAGGSARCGSVVNSNFNGKLAIACCGSDSRLTGALS
jgi:hypothetical protein